MKYFFVRTEDNKYLVHHGIKGQQWGVKNGPPYPLNRISTAKLKKKRERYAKESEAWRSGKRTKEATAGSIIFGGVTGALHNGKTKASAASGAAFNAAVNGATTYVVSSLAQRRIAESYDKKIANIDRELARRGVSSKASSIVNKFRSKPVSK